MNECGKVLLADDEDLFRDTTADLLRKASYSVDCAGEVAEAVKLLSANRYDVLISDIKMPGNSELQLVVQALETRPGLPIILVTGYPALETAVKAIKPGVVAYLVKPLVWDELLVHVRVSTARSRLYQTVGGLRQQLAVWDGGMGQVELCLREPLSADVSEPGKSLLATAFDILANALAALRRAMEVLAMIDKPSQSDDLRHLLRNSELVEHALHETIGALEESKHVFKSKRLKELRHQLQGVLGVLEQGKQAEDRSHRPPHYRVHAAVGR